MVDERAPATESELMEQLEEEMRRITVPDYLRHLLVSLSSLGFQRLGLTAESAAERDLVQSRMAIDAFEALVGVLAPALSKEDESLFRSALHQMRMAFVRASAGESAGPEGVEEDEAAQGGEKTEAGAEAAGEGDNGGDS
ncbi:MAG TPA: DUF1844 domain-containing protein [Thermoleophilia bacterium]|nr:DUF1844 domain-containing protein [Thermoleophilia bacterium]